MLEAREACSIVIAAGDVSDHARGLIACSERSGVPLLVLPDARAAAVQAHLWPISLVLLFENQLSSDAIRAIRRTAPAAHLLQVSMRCDERAGVDWVTSSDPSLFVETATRLVQRQPASATRLSLGPLVVDPEHGAVRLGDVPIRLPRAQFRLLFLLAREPGKVFDRRTLCATVLGTHGSLRRIDWHVARLRAALGPLGRCIRTWHTGYSIAVPD
jgi:DNA-binding response OmpR family regulator